MTALNRPRFRLAAALAVLLACATPIAISDTATRNVILALIMSNVVGGTFFIT